MSCNTNSSTQDKTPARTYNPNMRHEPLHETDKDRVYGDILRWLTLAKNQ